jgi:hypothetical protein
VFQSIIAVNPDKLLKNRASYNPYITFVISMPALAKRFIEWGRELRINASVALAGMGK